MRKIQRHGRTGRQHAGRHDASIDEGRLCTSKGMNVVVVGCRVGVPAIFVGEGFRCG